MIAQIISLLSTGLTLWNNIEKNKYTDKLLELKTKYYEEENKPEDQRSDAVMDNIIFELKILSDSFITSVNQTPVGPAQ